MKAAGHMAHPSAAPEALRWVPNGLSVVRIGLVPVWLALAFVERERFADGLEVRRWPLLLLIAVIGGTDILDGWLARRFGLATPTGAVLDAVADKLATVAAVTFLTFVGAPAFTALPVWLWAVLVARDLLLGVGFVVLRARSRQVDAEHLWHGRAATALLSGTVLLACAGAASPLIAALSAAIVALVVPGTGVYLRRGFRQLRR
jgi:phosphatidylglycerophosphate synthase